MYKHLLREDTIDTSTPAPSNEQPLLDQSIEEGLL